MDSYALLHSNHNSFVIHQFEINIKYRNWYEHTMAPKGYEFRQTFYEDIMDSSNGISGTDTYQYHINQHVSVNMKTWPYTSITRTITSDNNSYQYHLHAYISCTIFFIYLIIYLICKYIQSPSTNHFCIYDHNLEFF